MTAPSSDARLFLREFVRSPLTTAAVLPSSPALAAAMTAPIAAMAESVVPVVVELGPGTGAFTGAIRRQLAGRGRHLAIELSDVMADVLTARYPEVDVVRTDANDLCQVLADRDLPAADAVVSGLPWAAYSGPLIRTIAGSLAPNGTFTQFAYTWSRWAPPARRLLAGLRAAFDEVEVSRTVWRNVPPAVVYLARGPKS
ncbi:methyltransferase domain-containing protein [Fodinicola feengrottensis]|uniref:Methyltransferase domain-containing protein n=1 Tax=Fodinicola feengrottensis TaxID=435914 RepID=A0ABN2IT16_9ACTN